MCKLIEGHSLHAVWVKVPEILMSGTGFVWTRGVNLYSIFDTTGTLRCVNMLDRQNTKTKKNGTTCGFLAIFILGLRFGHQVVIIIVGVREIMIRLC